MREDTYPNGYQPKIDYYQFKLNEAIDALDTKSMNFYAKKLEYFMAQHAKSVDRINGLYA